MQELPKQHSLEATLPGSYPPWKLPSPLIGSVVMLGPLIGSVAVLGPLIGSAAVLGPLIGSADVALRPN